MKNIYFIFILGFFFSCSSEGDVFVDTWVEKRNPENVWKIEKKGGQYVGNRLSGKDFYNYDQEKWEVGQEGKFKDPNKYVLILNSLDSNGSKMTYIESKDVIMRFPPGTTYIRKNQ